MDGRILRHGIISSCQSAATSSKCLSTSSISIPVHGKTPLQTVLNGAALIAEEAVSYEEQRLTSAEEKTRQRKSFSINSSSSYVCVDCGRTFVLPSDCSATRELTVAVSTYLTIRDFWRECRGHHPFLLNGRTYQDFKALLVTSSRVISATASTRPLPFLLDNNL